MQKSTARLVDSVMMMARVGLRGRKRPRSAWRNGSERSRSRRNPHSVASVSKRRNADETEHSADEIEAGAHIAQQPEHHGHKRTQDQQQRHNVGASGARCRSPPCER